MFIANNIQSLKDILKQYRPKGPVGFVPTMGYLHNGHISLIDKAKEISSTVVVSIFVNPKQFNDKKDFNNYPKDIEKDLEILKSKDVTIAFLPHSNEIYPKNFQTTVYVSDISKNWEGHFRPGHFEGVTTIVNILFNLVRPQFAFFGEKDFQQLKVIERMTIDLCLPIKIIPCKTVREENGLALSSRNVRLSPKAKEKASSIYNALSLIKTNFAQNITDKTYLLNEASKIILSADIDIEYLDIVEETTLQSATTLKSPKDNLRAIFAGYLEEVRLIDNLKIYP